MNRFTFVRDNINLFECPSWVKDKKALFQTCNWTYKFIREARGPSEAGELVAALLDEIGKAYDTGAATAKGEAPKPEQKTATVVDPRPINDRNPFRPKSPK